MTTLLEFARAANVALLTTAVLTLIIWLADTWGSLSWGRRISMASIRFLLIGGAIGSAIKYLTGAPVNISILIVTIGSFGVIVGQWMARKDNPHLISALAVLAIVEGADGKHAPCTHPGCLAARDELRRLAAAER